MTEGGAMVIDESRPTGKQLFLSNLAGDEAVIRAAEGAAEDELGLEISEELFDGGDDEDLDDLDDEDYEDDGEEDYESDDDNEEKS